MEPAIAAISTLFDGGSLAVLVYIAMKMQDYDKRIKKLEGVGA